MRRLAALTQRELLGITIAPSSFVILALFLFVTGAFFRFVLAWVGGDVTTAYRVFAASVYFQLFLAVLPPLLTMRAVAAERASGTLELLLTAPVRDGEVILAKFVGAYAFYAALWAPTLLFPIALEAFGGSPDTGQITAFMIGILALGALLVAIGIFSSSITTSVPTAFFAAFVVNVVFLFGMNGLAWLARSPGIGAAIETMNATVHLEEFARGVVDVRRLVFYVAGTALFLFLATRGLESRRWR